MYLACMRCFPAEIACVLPARVEKKRRDYRTVSLGPSLVLSIIWTSFVQFPFYWSQFVVDRRSKSAVAARTIYIVLSLRRLNVDDA